LSKVADLGLLSKASAAGVSLSSLEGVLIAADDAGAVLLAAEKVPGSLGLIEFAVGAAPGLLSVPAPLLFATGAASLAGAGAVVLGIPDDSVVNIAVQTALVIPLATLIPGATFVLGALKSS